MHDTAYEIGREFFNVYIKESARILEVGSQNINGTLRDFASRYSEYVGMDICPGPGVDVVSADPYKFPFKGNHFDAVLSSSCFEHDQMFWLTFLEMVRVAKPRGYIYINAPSNGNYHRHPVDNWRFYPDAALALECWARRQGKTVKLIECFTARRKQDIWNDCVMIFSKKKFNHSDNKPRVVDKFPGSVNVRYLLSPNVENLSEETEDRILLRQAAETVETQEAKIASIIGQRDQAVAALALAQEELAASRASLADLERSNGLLKATVAEREASLLEAEQQGSALRESMLTEIALARAALTRASEKTRECLTAGEAMRAELQSRRGALAFAQREAREGAATVEALQAQIGSLQSELAAARAVGRAAIEALRCDVAELPEVAPNSTRATSVLRRLGFRAADQLPFAPMVAGRSSPV
jgi:SAM-dependent methyltransferase